MANCIDFFLGSNSEDGFISYFDELERFENGFVIKGSPGSGKSTFMKKIIETAGADGITERIHCASDPDSLDCVIIHSKDFSIADGTPPHVIEPKYPAAGQDMICFYDAFDKPKLKKNKQKIMDLNAEISGCHKKFCNLLRCANVLLSENADIILPFCDKQKIIKTVKNIAKRELEVNKGSEYKENVRMISAFTPKGLITYEQTLNTLCDKIYVLNDYYDVITDFFMDLIRGYAMKGGYSYYVCYSPLAPGKKISHIIIPEKKLAFVSRNKFVTLGGITPYRNINATRFMDKEILKAKKTRLNFNKKTATELLDEGVKRLQNAKMLHDKLEDYYVPYIDFGVIGKKLQKLLLELKKI